MSIEDIHGIAAPQKKKVQCLSRIHRCLCSAQHHQLYDIFPTKSSGNHGPGNHQDDGQAQACQGGALEAPGIQGVQVRYYQGPESRQGAQEVYGWSDGENRGPAWRACWPFGADWPRKEVQEGEHQGRHQEVWLDLPFCVCNNRPALFALFFFCIHAPHRFCVFWIGVWLALRLKFLFFFSIHYGLRHKCPSISFFILLRKPGGRATTERERVYCCCSATPSSTFFTAAKSRSTSTRQLDTATRTALRPAQLVPLT